MAQIIGTESNDTLTGTDGDDVIEGRGGHDTIRGGLGNDTIYGGDGDDSLYGDGGNDRIEGGAGRNFMNGGAGDDVMIGGDGDDHVYSDEGSDVVELGKGNDYISLVRGTVDTSHVSVALGDGDDSMRLVSYGPTSFAFDFGAGSDRINVELLSGTATITLGAGADIVDLGYLDMGRPPFSGGTVGHMVFTDFETGAAGDRIDWLNGLVKSLTNWNQALNPFGTGHLRLIQSGADAVLQIDRDGGGNSYVTIATFLGRQVGSFTTENFHGYAVDGSLEDGRSISGSIGADTLRGTSGDDFVDGLEGPDKLYGGVGNDRLDGGDGSDQLFGELGGDVLNGGLGGDSLDGGQGDDVLNGDDGDDSLRADAGFDILHGGAGDDYLGFSYVASATGYGGDGMDRFSLYSTTAGGNYTFDGGAGADTFDLLQFRGVLNLTLGSGIDTVIFGNSEPAAFLAGAVVVIADFQAGAGGDVIDIKTMIAGLPSSWDGSENPFGSGRARLLQIGADTLSSSIRMAAAIAGRRSFCSPAAPSEVSRLPISAASLRTVRRRRV
jgi:Ca2+-binding RTX toxin-like protein